MVYADEVSRRIYEPGEDGLSAVVSEFGEQALDADGRVDRRALAKIVFSDEGARRRLEGAVWPVMAAVVEREFADAEDRGAPAAVIEAAVLFEAGWDRLVDEVWTVAAPQASIVSRVGKRDGLSAEQVKARIAAQLPAEEKERRADRVILNDGSLDELKARVEQAWRDLTGRPSTASSD